MGAITFAVEMMTDTANTLTSGAAYSQLCADASHEYGSNGYNGSISTTSGYHQVLQNPTTLGAANTFAGWAMDLTSDDAAYTRFAPHKWEDALAIPVLSDDAFRFTSKSHTLTLADLGDQVDVSDATDYGLRHAFTEAATAAAISEFGTKVHDVQVELTVKRRIVTETATGPAKTMYVIADRNGRGGGNRYATRSEAVSAAKEYLTKYPNSRPVNIQAMRVYETGAAGDTVAVSMRSVPQSVKAKVTVTLAHPKAATSKAEKHGWLFYGVAST